MLSDKEKERYKRQLILIGEWGQEKLGSLSVLVAGAGGLGSAISLNCAYAGIGTIRIADSDIVERSNLNRQTLFVEKDIGRPKVEAAEEHLLEINPSLKIEPVNTSINEKNVNDLVNGVDLVFDGLDNYNTRNLLNDAIYTYNIPFIHGAVNGLYGQVSTIIPGETPCLRCLVPYPPDFSPIPAFAVTTGVIGGIQVTEGIKYALGIGDLLKGRILFWDGLNCEAEVMDVNREPLCPYCGEPE